MEESRTPGLGIALTSLPVRRSRKVGDFLYALYFLPILCIIKSLAAMFLLVRFNKLVTVAHRLFGVSGRVLYLDPFFPDNAGFRYRTEKWMERLSKNGLTARAGYVFDQRRFESLLSAGKIRQFHRTFLFRRIRQCIASLRYNCVIVRRELLLFNDYGDLFLDRFLLGIHPNVVLDFDDDISAAKQEPRTITKFGRVMFENGVKFGDSLKLYRRFIVGSTYLSHLLTEMNPSVSETDKVTIPTCVDYENHPGKVYGEGEYVHFGWIGSAANHYLLDIIIPVLSKVAQRHRIKFVVITGDDYVPRGDFDIVHLPWSLETEIESLRRIDIGLMPLYNNAQERGKCGFKLIQYMGLGIVSIASAVTTNCEIIDDGENGFLVRAEEDWFQVIEEVLARRSEFARIGASARAKIQRQFSFQANTEKYLEFVRAK